MRHDTERARHGDAEKGIRRSGDKRKEEAETRGRGEKKVKRRKRFLGGNKL